MDLLLKSQRGMGLIEVVVAAGIMGVVSLGMMTMYSNQVKANNYLEFQLRKQEVKGEVLGQFLDLNLNCQCWLGQFGAQPFPVAGTAAITTGTPIDRIGRYSYVTAGSCVGATMPNPIITTAAGTDGVRATNIQIINVGSPVGSTYSATLRIELASNKDLLGARALQPIDLPILVNTAPAGANVNPVSCAMSGTGGGGGGAFPFQRCRLVLHTWDSDTCSGNNTKRYTKWSDTFVANVENEALYNAAGVPYSNRAGRNYNPGDTACLKLAIQCQ